MKKNIAKITSAVALVTALSTVAVASEVPQLGLGVGVAGDTTTLRGTLEIQDNVRLEPYFGFSYLDPKNGSSRSTLKVGSALHMQKTISSDLRAYYGPYVGISSSDDGITSTTTFDIGPVVGVEYALDKQFTLGAEMRMNFGFGDDTVIGTNSSVLLRYYF